MSRESTKHKRQRAQIIIDRIDAHYPETSGFLNYHTPFELTIAVVLSAQTTDRAVNLVTPALFKRWPTPTALAAASVTEVEKIIHSLGFFHSKARRVIGCAQTLITEFDSEVPRSAAELMRLPGVGRKTANVILNTAFDIVEGIAVDTHVDRIAHNLGLSEAKSPMKTEEDLLSLIPQDRWKEVNHRWITFGRTICKAPRPRCEECFISDMCPQETPRCLKDILSE
jgi:endonuclease III